MKPPSSVMTVAKVEREGHSGFREGQRANVVCSRRQASSSCKEASLRPSYQSESGAALSRRD